MISVVLGNGEIGSAIVKLCKICSDEVIIVDIKEQKVKAKKATVMHVCIPGTADDFIDTVVEQYEKFKPELVFIHSTTEPGITDKVIKKIGQNVAHTQVHGKHHGNKMLSDMLRYQKFVATSHAEVFDMALHVFTRVGFNNNNIVWIDNVKTGEYIKLLSTSFYGYLIAFMQQVLKIANDENLNYEDLCAFRILETDDYNIKKIYPGVIGGHCVLPNLKILQKINPSLTCDSVIKSNEGIKEWYQ